MYCRSQQRRFMYHNFNFKLYCDNHVRRGNVIEGHTRINGGAWIRDHHICLFSPYHRGMMWLPSSSKDSSADGAAVFLTGQAKMERPKIFPLVSREFHIYWPSLWLQHLKGLKWSSLYLEPVAVSDIKFFFFIEWKSYFHFPCTGILKSLLSWKLLED